MRYTTKVTLSSQATLGNFGRVWTSDVIGDHQVSFTIHLYLPFQFNTEMYSTAIHFRAYHHAFSLTRKRVLVVNNFVPTITLPSNTEMYSTAIHFRASGVI